MEKTRKVIIKRRGSVSNNRQDPVEKPAESRETPKPEQQSQENMHKAVQKAVRDVRHNNPVVQKQKQTNNKDLKVEYGYYPFAELLKGKRNENN